MELVAGAGLHQAAHHQEGGQVLGNGSGQGHARHIHVKDHHEKDVQAGVGDAGGGEEEQGPLGVSNGPQDARAKVVDHHGGHPQKDDAHIEDRLVQQVGRGVQPATIRNAPQNTASSRAVWTASWTRRQSWAP